MFGSIMGATAVAARLQSLGWLKVGENLEAALSRYKSHFGCGRADQPPAAFDPETERHLCACRTCRHPDVMPLGETLQKWPANMAVTWFLTNTPASLSRTAAESAFLSACQSWASVCGARLVPTTNPKTALLTVSFDKIDGRGRVLGWSELPDDSGSPRSLRFDAEETWCITDKPRPYEIDFVRVAAHELGHVLGIGHIAAGNLLQPMYDPTIRTPKAGDVAEATARYGPPTLAPQPPSSASAASGRVVVEIDAAELRAVRVTGMEAAKVSIVNG